MALALCLVPLKQWANVHQMWYASTTYMGKEIRNWINCLTTTPHPHPPPPLPPPPPTLTDHKWKNPLHCWKKSRQRTNVISIGGLYQNFEFNDPKGMGSCTIVHGHICVYNGNTLFPQYCFSYSTTWWARNIIFLYFKYYDPGGKACEMGGVNCLILRISKVWYGNYTYNLIQMEGV